MSSNARSFALRQSVARVAWTPRRVEELVRRMPKVETHLHLDGSLSTDALVRLARAQEGNPLRDLSRAELRRRTVVDEPRENLAAVLAAFETILPLLRNAEALEAAAFDLASSAARQQTRHVEVRFAPALHVAPGLDLEGVLRAVLAGLERGRRAFGVGSGVIVCLIRPPSLVSLDENERMLDLALAHRGRGVVGVDLAGDEAAAPLALYAGLLRRAKAAGLGLTAHAGEVPGSEDLDAALALGVDRLGHATQLARAPDRLAEVVRRGIALEVNLTSNLRTGAVESLAAHPVRQWYAAGATISLNTDDPGVFDIDLPGEYLHLHRELGFPPADLVAVALQGVDSLFLPPAGREELGRVFAADLERLLPELASG